MATALGVVMDPNASRRRSLRSAALPRLGGPDKSENGNGWIGNRRLRKMTFNRHVRQKPSILTLKQINELI